MKKETHTLKRERLKSSNRRLTNFFASGTDQLQAVQKLKTKVVAAEATSAYHCCTHNLATTVKTVLTNCTSLGIVTLTYLQSLVLVEPRWKT